MEGSAHGPAHWAVCGRWLVAGCRPHWVLQTIKQAWPFRPKPPSLAARRSACCMPSQKMTSGQLAMHTGTQRNQVGHGGATQPLASGHARSQRLGVTPFQSHEAFPRPAFLPWYYSISKARLPSLTQASHTPHLQSLGWHLLLQVKTPQRVGPLRMAP